MASQLWNSVVATKQHYEYTVRVDDRTAKLAIIANNVNSFHVDDLTAKQECIPVRCVQGVSVWEGLCPGSLCPGCLCPGGVSIRQEVTSYRDPSPL